MIVRQVDPRSDPDTVAAMDAVMRTAFATSGVPSTAPWLPPGPKMMTSYFARRLAVSRIAFGSM